MLEYKTAITREVTNALQETFANLPEVDFRNIYAGPEYPMERLSYPCVIVRYEQSRLERAGIAHYYSDEDTARANHWLFEGTLGFTMMAETTQDIDRLGDQILEIVCWGDIIPQYSVFHQEVADCDWIAIALMKDQVASTSYQLFPSPWNAENEQIYTMSHSISICGEFFSGEEIDGELIKLSRIIIYPYRPDQDEPTGSNDPNPWWG